MPDEALVIRFRPVSPERVLASAEKEYRRTGRHAVSVFAGVRAAGESMVDLKSRLLAASEVAGVSADGNPQFYVCSEASQLKARGFTIMRDGDADEVAEHFSVELRHSPTMEDAQRFLDAFDVREKRPQ